jgi:hypothetical protein
MRNDNASSPFFLVSTLVKSESFAENEDRAGKVAERLNAADIPFKRLDLKVVGVDEDAAPVFLLSFEDLNQVQKIAIENFQSHYIAVNAFLVGTRVALTGPGVLDREDAVIGKLGTAVLALLESGTGYLEAQDGTIWIWK